MTDIQFISLILSILIPVVGLFGFLYRELKEWRSETRSEISEIRKEIHNQVLRSDQLYTMFIDLLKKEKSA